MKCKKMKKKCVRNKVIDVRRYFEVSMFGITSVNCKAIMKEVYEIEKHYFQVL